MTEQALPNVDAKIEAVLEALGADARVQSALALAQSEVQRAMAEQIELCEIEAPTFEEDRRAARLAELMRECGLTDVTIDAVGNVVGRRPGRDPEAPVLALGAHMDSVFPAGTDVKVRREGNVYRAPGIGDNCSGLRALLQILRMFEHADLTTQGDVLFVGTVGEEGKGDILGSKTLCDGSRRIDGFIAIDSTDVGRILRGATGSHRWRFTVKGPGGHSYAEFERCPSAIHAICRAGALMADLRVPSDPKTTYTIGTIRGGTSVNTIAAEASVDVDMRSVDNDVLLKLEAEVMRAFEAGVEAENAFRGVTDEALQLRLEKKPIGNRPAGWRPDDCPVLQCARAAQQALGITLKAYTCASTDANAPMSRGIPSTCLSSGGRGVNAHTLDEYFVMEDTHLGPQLIFLTALALAGSDRAEAVLPRLAA